MKIPVAATAAASVLGFGSWSLAALLLGQLLALSSSSLSFLMCEGWTSVPSRISSHGHRRLTFFDSHYLGEPLQQSKRIDQSSSLSSLSSSKKSFINSLLQERQTQQQPTSDDDTTAETALHLADIILERCRAGLAMCGMASALWLLSPSLPSYADHAVVPMQSFSRTTVLEPSSSSSETFAFPSKFPNLLVASTAPAPGAVLDEVWTLIDKYYIDRNFNGQDWKRAKQVYEKQLEQQIKTTTQDNDSAQEEMKLVNNMVKSLGDKYSRLLNKEQYAAIQKYDLIGVGVTLMPKSSSSSSGDDSVVAAATGTSTTTPEIIVGAPPIPGSAADRAGLQVGDRVTQINGISTQGRTAFDIIDQIAENPNAPTVTMTILPSSSTSPNDARDMVLERQFQQIKNPIRYQITERRSDGTIVGFIRITEFNSLIKANLENALKNLKAQGANAFVIDLRRNGGGAFQSAVEVSSLFFEDRVATYVVDGTTATLPFKTAKGQVLIDATDPIVLWIDGGSASAAEVLAASLHDNCKAVIMGDKSFGKGLIQAVYGLKNGAGLVLTVAKYVTPNQAEIQGFGIQPDINGQAIVPSPLLSNLFGTADTSKIDFADIRNRLSSGVCPTKALE
ncbi:hypothetical protein ACA910_018236 [Epithemia clementina (nom. ined.)]